MCVIHARRLDARIKRLNPTYMRGGAATITAVDPGSMSQLLVPDGLWVVMAPLLEPVQREPTGRRPPIRNRATLISIVFVLRTGLPWEIQRSEMVCSFGMSYRRRLRNWQLAVV